MVYNNYVSEQQTNLLTKIKSKKLDLKVLTVYVIIFLVKSKNKLTQQLVITFLDLNNFTKNVILSSSSDRLTALSYDWVRVSHKLLKMGSSTNTLFNKWKGQTLCLQLHRLKTLSTLFQQKMK
jgi:hypothetical protein